MLLATRTIRPFGRCSVGVAALKICPRSCTSDADGGQRRHLDNSWKCRNSVCLP